LSQFLLRDYQRAALISVLLVAGTLLVFSPVADNGFICLDDGKYVTGNSHLRGGFTRENLEWAFTTFHAANWHPITWLSHLADVRLFGLNPAGHHLTSLLVHAANVLLVFLVLGRLTGSRWRSGLAAALFAVHPLHVESVAWISERKDVLSAFFWMSTLVAYTRYARSPGLKRYGLTALVFALGLMAKPMLVTLPFILLLLDWWPLGRALRPAAGERRQGPAAARFPWLPLVLEKVPLFVLAAASCAVTLRAQQEGWMVKSVKSYPIGVRLANALWSYLRYLGKVVYPANLGIPYPHPGASLPVWQAVVALLILLCLTGGAVRTRRQRPSVLVGWLWFLGALVPVIGLVQVADQAMADRYMYLPLLGLLLAVVWSLPAVAVDKRYRAAAIVAGGAVILAVLGTMSRAQVRLWRDDITLFSRTIQVTPENALAHYNLGTGLARQGNAAAAIRHFREALRMRADFAEAHYNLARALEETGEYDEALGQYRDAVRIMPDYPYALNNLGGALSRSGRIAEAVTWYEKALLLTPEDPELLYNLGTVLSRKGDFAAAAARYAQALRIRPDYAAAARALRALRSLSPGAD